uniref:Capping protein regulator and myosin 1 linker 3 n=1 Tax=Xiphophorus couchianus TaxID=32473 RepID=A0A3B5LL88_9TELE
LLSQFTLSWSMLTVTLSIRKVLDKQPVKFVRAIKQETRGGKSEDRILVLATWRLYLFAVKVPTKVEVTFNFLEIRAMNTYPDYQVVIDTDKTTYSLRLQTQEQLDHMVNHINYALSRVFNNSIYAPPICRAEGDVPDGSHKFSPNSESSLEAPKTCGGFSETYAALCDYNGIGCKEEVQWVRRPSMTEKECDDTESASRNPPNSRRILRRELTVFQGIQFPVSLVLSRDFPQKMASALSENPASVIHSLNLAHNTLDNQGVSNLIQQVCRLNKGLRLLNLSKTSLSSKGVVSLSQALCSSDDYSNSLLHLDLSKNPGVLSGEDATNLYLFLAQPNCLVHLDLSGTDCTVDSLFGALLRGCCADLSYLNLSKNSFSHRWASDIFLCLDADLLAVIPAFSRHPSLKHLMLGKNFNIKGKVLDEILQKLVHLVQEEECALQSLSLADSRLRQRGTVLVNALGSNACLRKVDLSGNLLEDSGAKMLSKALQINTTLRSVTWDRNNTTGVGFQDVARALEHNFTLQYMPLPLCDIAQAYRGAPEKTEQALAKIQRALLRNNQTQRFSQKQALRLHQGLVTSTAEQVMERLCIRVQQQLCVLKSCEDGDEVQTARQILKEARNSRALYPSLCELAHVLSVDGPVKQRLDTLAGELAKAADKELQVVVDSMVSLCRELCPMSCSAAERLSPPLSAISEQVSIPCSAIRSALMERAAEDINQALEEVKLSVVSYLTNSIVDQILQELYTTHKTLLRQVSQAKRWDDVGTGRRSVRHSRLVESLDFPDEDFGDTIAIKKRSSRTRRIRPVSTRMSLGDEPSPSPTPSAPSHSASLTHSASWECLSTLPTNGSPLRHVTHVRPRPPRRHRAAHIPPESHCSENGGVSMLEDGLPDFYSKRVLPDSQLSSLNQAQSLRRKKRRSVLSIFSGFRKNLSRVGAWCVSRCASENVYSMIQHPKDTGRSESAVPGANGTLSSPLPAQGVPAHGLRAASPPCSIQRQVQCTGSSLGTDRQMETARQERIVPLTESRTEAGEDVQSSGIGSARPEPPPHSTKPNLAVIRQRHLQDSSEEQSERLQEEKQRGRGPEGQRPLIPKKVCGK